MSMIFVTTNNIPRGLYKMKQAERLKEFTAYQCSELSEYWSLLWQLDSYGSYMSNDLKKALNKEIDTQLKFIKQTYILKNVTETLTVNKTMLVEK